MKKIVSFVLLLLLAVGFVAAYGGGGGGYIVPIKKVSGEGVPFVHLNVHRQRAFSEKIPFEPLYLVTARSAFVPSQNTYIDIYDVPLAKYDLGACKDLKDVWKAYKLYDNYNSSWVVEAGGQLKVKVEQPFSVYANTGKDCVKLTPLEFKEQDGKKYYYILLPGLVDVVMTKNGNKEPVIGLPLVKPVKPVVVPNVPEDTCASKGAFSVCGGKIIGDGSRTLFYLADLKKCVAHSNSAVRMNCLNWLAASS